MATSTGSAISLVNGLARRRSGSQEPFLEVDVREPQLYELLPAHAGPEERHDDRVVAAALLSFSGALDELPHLRVAQGAAVVLLERAQLNDGDLIEETVDARGRIVLQAVSVEPRVSPKMASAIRSAARDKRSVLKRLAEYDRR